MERIVQRLTVRNEGLVEENKWLTNLLIAKEVKEEKLGKLKETMKTSKVAQDDGGASSCNLKTCKERVEMLEALLAEKEAELEVLKARLLRVGGIESTEAVVISNIADSSSQDDNQIEQNRDRSDRTLANVSNNNIERTPKDLNNNSEHNEDDNNSEDQANPNTDNPEDSNDSQSDQSESQVDTTENDAVSSKRPKRQALMSREYSGSPLPVPPNPGSSRSSASITGGIPTYIPPFGKRNPPKLHGVVENRRHLGWYCLCNPGKAFKNQGMLSEHIKYFNSDPKFQCPDCPYRFVKLADLRKHLLDSHKRILFKGTIGCSDCGAIFTDKQDHKTHRLNFHVRRTEAHSRTHARDDRFEDLGVFRCHCGRQFSTQNYLTSHIKTYTNPAVFECHQCSGTFRKLCFLQRHVRRIHKMKTEKKLGCGTCGEAFDTKKLFQKHNKDAHGIRAYNQDEDSPKKHGAARPTDRWNFRCLCGMGFTSKTQLMDHIRNKGPRIPFKCTHCGVEYREHTRLKSHIRKTHNLPDYDGFGCIRCGTSFPSITELRRHQDSTHGRGKAKK